MRSLPALIHKRSLILRNHSLELLGILSQDSIGVVPGSHRRGALPTVGSDEKYLDPAAYPLHSLTLLSASRGSMLFLNYLTIHGSALNTSQEARTTLLVQMRDPADLPLAAVHLSRGQGMMLRGVDPLANATPSVSSDVRFAPSVR